MLKSLHMKDSRGVTQKMRLYPEQLSEECLAKFNPEKLLICVDAGLRVYLHKLAGYQVTSSAVQPQQFLLPENYLEALEALVATEKEKQRLMSEKQALLQKAEENRPKVEFAEAVLFSEDSLEFGEYAKIIGTGRNRLMQKLRDLSILMKNSTIPYQKYCDAGYFEVSQEITTSGKLIPFALITGKGQMWLYQKLKEAKFIAPKTLLDQPRLDLQY